MNTHCMETFIIFLYKFPKELSPTSDSNLVKSLMNIHESMMDELTDENKYKQCSPEQVEAWIMVSPTHPPVISCDPRYAVGYILVCSSVVTRGHGR